MEPGGETAGVIDIERIAIGRKNKEREDRGLWSGRKLGERGFFFGGLNV